MIGQEPFNKTENLIFYTGGGLLLFAFFYNLGIYPLYLEEPRRGLIALEMLINDNLWVPTQTGDLYYRKPPVYNWVLLLSYNLFGEANEFATRFFSVLSHLVSSLMVFQLTKKYVNREVALFASAGFVLLVDILLSYSTIGEIDLFYSLVTSSSIFLIYVFGERKQYWYLFLTVYLLTAIGFLTKGLTSLPYTAISLLVYFIWKKDFRRLLGIQHVFGILLLALSLFGYFYTYSQYEDVSGWWSTLISESSDKATSGGISAVIHQLLTFPIDTLKNLIPVSFFIPLLFLKGSKSILKENKFIWFCVLIFVFNFPLYWISTEAKSRYIYPIFPFAAISLTYLSVNLRSNFWSIFLKYFVLVCATILVVASIGIHFVEELEVIPRLDLLSTVLGVGAILIYGLWFKKEVRPYVLFLLFFVFLKFGMSSVFPPSRQLTTGAAKDKAMALQMAEITHGEELLRYKDLRMSYTIVFYLERERNDIVYSTDKIIDGYIICYDDDLKDFTNYEVIKEFYYDNRIPMSLIKVE